MPRKSNRAMQRKLTKAAQKDSSPDRNEAEDGCPSVITEALRQVRDASVLPRHLIECTFAEKEIEKIYMGLQKATLQLLKSPDNRDEMIEYILAECIFGAYVTVGNSCQVKERVIAGDNVTIGNNVVVGKDSQIGAGATITAGSIVPDGTVIPPGSTY